MPLVCILPHSESLRCALVSGMHPRGVFPGLMTLVALSGFPNAESTFFRKCRICTWQKIGIFCTVTYLYMGGMGK